MTIREAQQRLLFQLYHLYDDGEASVVADLVMEHLTGWKRIERTLNGSVKLSARQLGEFDKYIGALLTNAPVQYVIGEAWFYERRFEVSKAVLIPRQETEELVHWALQTLGKTTASVLDVGTGSGCIAVTLKLESPDYRVLACDISGAALDVAARNAAALGADVSFLKTDILDTRTPELFPDLDLVISNPPYIPEKQRSGMMPQVVNHEPHQALFAPDNDPLLFYRAILNVSLQKLRPGGWLMVETHEDLANDVAKLFDDPALRTVDIKKDMQGKNRMVRAMRC